MYPEHMNLYGDRGNVLALAQRARWRGIPVSITGREVGQPIDWSEVDLVFMGGGEDSHQSRIAEDFLALGPELASRLHEGLPMLAICGAYQLLGKYYKTSDGRELPGLGYLDVWTEPGTNRAIGDVVTETSLPIKPPSLVGFENHGGRTYLGSAAKPLGTVKLGQGNNGEDRTEGAIQDRVIGTYLHGSLLPKNPHLADLLLRWALLWQGYSDELEPLPEDEERAAHQTILARAPNS
nr:glutamine amidotransferase [Sulfobacillus harzensis]